MVEKKMKKLCTFDDIMVAFISALGYGFGETIAKLFGWPELVCMVASFGLGLALQEIISKICFSKTVQKKPINRIITYTSVFLVFLIAQYISTRWMGVSMLDYVSDEVVSVIGMPILGFAVNLLIRWYRIRKIRKHYGDGSEGFVFDVKEKDIEEINKQNQEIHGKYDTDCAVKTRTGVFVGGKIQEKDFKLGEKPDTTKLEGLLRNETIFGVDLVEAGLADKVCDYFVELTAGPGAVRATVHKYVNE